MAGVGSGAHALGMPRHHRQHRLATAVPNACTAISASTAQHDRLRRADPLVQADDTDDIVARTDRVGGEPESVVEVRFEINRCQIRAIVVGEQPGPRSAIDVRDHCVAFAGVSAPGSRSPRCSTLSSRIDGERPGRGSSDQPIEAPGHKNVETPYDGCGRTANLALSRASLVVGRRVRRYPAPPPGTSYAWHDQSFEYGRWSRGGQALANVVARVSNSDS